MLATATAANAADIPVAPVIPPAPPAPVPVAPTFDWAGPYVGAYAGYLFGPGFVQVGAQAGYNFVSGGFLGGIEVQAGAVIAGGVAFEGNVNARLGALLGDRFLLYTEAGVGIITGAAFTYTFGGGIEAAIGPQTTIFAEAKGLGTFGGACCAVTVQGGLNWHL